MSTNIRSIRIVLPATEDRPELDLTSRFDVEGGIGESVGFDGITAVYDERLGEPWSLEETSTLANPYPDGVTIGDSLGYRIADEVLAYIEEHDGPMTRIESFDPDGFAVVFVEDGGIDVHFVSYDDRDRVRFEALTSTLGLELTVELLDDDEIVREDPKRIVTVSGMIHRADGTATAFDIGRDGYQQWGGTREELGRSVDILSAMSNAAREHLPEVN